MIQDREDSQRQPRLEAEVDIPHPSRQDGTAQGPHGSRDLLAVRRLSVRDRRGSPC